jgi:hypothetical protein
MQPCPQPISLCGNNPEISCGIFLFPEGFRSPSGVGGGLTGRVFYRGGSSLSPKPNEVRINKDTGLLNTTHGVSLNTDPTKVERFGGAFRVVSIPRGLKIGQRGNDPGHYEIMPARPMTLNEYEELLQQVILELLK